MEATGSRYRIEQRVGVGAFGTVYRATMSTEGGLEKTVALKVLHPKHAEADGELPRLRDEARLLARVRHRAVVHVVDLVELPVGWTVVMEFVHGLDLRTLLVNTSFPPRAALEVVGEVAAALHEVWNTDGGSGPLKLVHRDIKPANLKLTPAGEIKVLDFGIASAELGEREAQTQEGQVLGTARYMAPECFDGQAEAPSDVYALGIVLMELLGQRTAAPAITEKRLTSVVSAVEHLAGPEVADLIQRMVAPLPADRPTALAVSRECRRLAADAPGAPLADWSMDIVPAITEEVTEPMDDDPWVGSTLTASRRTRPLPKRQVPVAPIAVGVGAMGLAAGLGLALLGLLGGGALWWGSSGSARDAWSLGRITRLEQVPALATSPTLDGSGTLVAYVLDGDVWSHPVGGTGRRLTSDVAEEASSPVLSPDGTQVAFAAGDAVLVRGLDGRTVRTLAGSARPVDWRGDALLTLSGGSPAVLTVVDGSTHRALGSGPGWTSARFAGDRVLVEGPGGLQWLQDGTSTPIGLDVSAADVLPDGTLLVSAFDGRVSRLLFVDPADPKLTTAVVTQLEGRVRTIDVAGEADRAVLGVERSSVRFRLVELDASRKRVVGERILPLPAEIDAAGLLPDGDGLMWLEPEGQLTPDARNVTRLVVWRGNLDGEKSTQIASIDSRDLTLAGMTNDHLVQYMVLQHAADRADVVSMRVDRPNEPQRIVAIAPEVVKDPWVSPDGKRVALRDAEDRVHVASLGAPVLTVPDPADGSGGWDVIGWTPDSASVLVIHDDGRLARLDADTLAEQVLATKVEDAMVVEGDVWILQREDGLYGRDGRTGAEWPILPVAHPEWLFEPTPSGRQVLITEINDRREMYVLDLER